MTAETRTFYKARTSFATIIDGRPVVVKQGELVGEGDPLLEAGRLKLFDPYEPESRFDQLTTGARRIDSRYEPAPEPDVPLALAEDPAVEPHAHPHRTTKRKTA